MYQNYDNPDDGLTYDDDPRNEDPRKEKPKRGMRDFGGPRQSLPPLQNDMLPTLFGFTRNDFDANLDGQLSEKQRDKLAKELKGEADSMWLLLSIFLGVAMLLALIFTLQGMDMGPLLLGAGAIVAPFMFIAYRRQRAITGDTQDDRVQAVEGVWDLAGDYGKEDFRLVVGKERLKIGQRTFDFLRNRAPGYLRAYYAEKSKLLLSAEVLPMPYDEEEKLKNDKLKNEQLILEDEAHDNDYDDAPQGDIVIDNRVQRQEQAAQQQAQKQHPLE
jgi:hypothetical protein